MRRSVCVGSAVAAALFTGPATAQDAAYRQVLAPVAGSLGWSALAAALPLATLFFLLGGLRWPARWAALAALCLACAARQSR